MVHLIDSPGNKNGQFTDGNPYATPPIPSTVVPSKWLNMVQNELHTVVAAAGLTLDDTSTVQLATAIGIIIDSKIDTELGRVITFPATADYTEGQGLKIGEAYFGRIRSSVLTGETATLELSGYFILDKALAETLTFGDRLYWDDTAKELTLDGGGLKHLVGACAVNTPSGSAVTLVHAWGNHALPPIP